MKKNLILSLCMLGLLASCQKENKGVTSPPKVKLTSKHDASLPPTYTDLTLMSDGSYEGVWNGCSIKVTNPSWDQVKYPTLQNGVPVMAESISTYDGSSSVDVINSGTSGNVFQVAQIIGSLATTAFNSTDFHSDVARYATAVNTWISGGQIGAVPDISSYILDTYTKTIGTDMVKSYTGKLIRVTTGSHLAIADMSYALPTAQTVAANPYSFPVYDAPNNVTYVVSGSHNVITSGRNTQNTVSYTTTGVFSITGGVISATGTIIRANGTTFNFDSSMVIQY